MIKLVIFDLDGTLVDSARDILDAANKVLLNYGHETISFEKVCAHIGEGFNPFLHSVAGDRAKDKEFVEEIFRCFQRHYDTQLMKHTKFYEGVESFLKEYQKISGTEVGVISNKPEYQVKIILKELGVDSKHLVEIYGGDTFEYKKPDPRPLQKMMDLAGVTPSETVMIGDSKADVEAAKAAGTHFIAVTFGYNTFKTLKDFGAEKFIHHFDELLPLLHGIGTSAE